MNPSNFPIINIYQTIIRTKITKYFMYYSNTSNDNLVVQFKPDV